MTGHLQRTRSDGFTLIELAVVVALVAILIAIAIPTFMGQTDAANDIAAQAVARNAANVERVYHLDNGEFTATSALLAALEPSLIWNQAGNAPGTIRIRMNATRKAYEVCVYTQSETGQWYGVYENTNTGSIYGRPDQLRGCSASIVSTNWTPDW